MKPWKTFASVALVLAVSACGGGGDKNADDPPSTTPATNPATTPATTQTSSTSPPVSPTPSVAQGDDTPAAAESLSATLADFAKVSDGGTCAQLAVYMLHSSQRVAGTPLGGAPTADECDAIDSRMFGFHSTKSQEYGTVGLAEGTGQGTREGEVALTLWMLDKDRAWKEVMEGYFDPQIGTQPKAETDFDSVSADFVEAMRGGRCDLAWSDVVAQSTFVVARDNDKSSFCSDVATALQDSTSFLYSLAGSSVVPQKVGETLDFGFYVLPMQDGRYVTLVATTGALNMSAAENLGHPKVGVLRYWTNRDPRA